MKAFQGFAYDRRPVASIVVVTLIAPIKSLDDSMFILFVFFLLGCVDLSLYIHVSFVWMDFDILKADFSI